MDVNTDQIDAYPNYIDNREFNLAEFTPKYFTPKPEFAKLLVCGDDLEEEMVVILEASVRRVDWQDIMRFDDGVCPALHDQMMTWNRWCRVTQLLHNESIDQYMFVGVYDDGTEKQLTADGQMAWYVTMESLEALRAKQKPTCLIRIPADSCVVDFGQFLAPFADSDVNFVVTYEKFEKEDLGPIDRLKGKFMKKDQLSDDDVDMMRINQFYRYFGLELREVGTKEDIEFIKNQRLYDVPIRGEIKIVLPSGLILERNSPGTLDEG